MEYSISFPRKYINRHLGTNVDDIEAAKNLITKNLLDDGHIAVKIKSDWEVNDFVIRGIITKSKEDDITCQECERKIKLGQEYSSFPQGFMHYACWQKRQENDIYIAKYGTCDNCHMELPPSRECCE